MYIYIASTSWAELAAFTLQVLGQKLAQLCGREVPPGFVEGLLGEAVGGAMDPS